MKNRLIVPSILFILALLITACGEEAIREAAPEPSTPASSDSPTPLPPDTSTPIPSETPIPIPSDTPTPLPTPTSTPVTTQISPIDDMVLNYIPGGTFQMGEDSSRGLAECQTLIEAITSDPCDERFFKNEGPVHSVTLDAFWMDAYEVTNDQYARCVAAGACSLPTYYHSDIIAGHYGDASYADYPVAFVTWDQANTYCGWAGRELPTEAQWEYAARGGLVGKLYPWGDTFDGSLANFCDVNCSKSRSNPNFDDGYAEAAPVGSYPANGYGLYDMAGNVTEWVADWFNPYPSETVNNPFSLEPSDSHPVRGGDWEYYGSRLRVSIRIAGFPETTNPSLGFRCVLAP